MTALIVIGVLILLSVLLVNIPVTAHIKFYGGRLDIAVKYFGIGIFPRGKKKKRSKKRKRSKLPSPKRCPSEDDEEIFEDIAEIGFTDSTNAGSASESGFDEDDSEEGYAENRGNEQENISEREFAAGGYQTENPGEKHAEISKNSPEDDSRNNEENSEEKSENYPRKSEKNLTKKLNKKSPDRNVRNGRKKSAKKTSSEKSDDESNADKSEKPLGERISELLENTRRKKNAALLLWELCEGHIKKLLGKFTVDGLTIDFAAADEDAAKAALAYGKLSAAFYNFLGVIMSFTRVNIKSVSIDCLYNTPSEKARYDGEFKVRLRPASVLNALAAILFGYVRGGEKYKAALNEFIGKKDK